MHYPNAPLIRTQTTTARDRPPVVCLVVACPHCGAEHWHGGGPSIMLAHKHLGQRVAHCAHKEATNRGYVITDPNGLLPYRVARARVSSCA